MKAVIHNRYGSPDQLEIMEVETPTPQDHEVRIKIETASLNATDFEIVRGNFFVRLTSGVRRPKNPRLGCDFAGRVDLAGKNVTEFKVGDEVNADLMYQKRSFGALAEYVCIPAKSLRKKPPSMSFEEAATIGQAGVLAVQGIRGEKPPKPGMQVLINGAGGGVGTYAIQLAKHYGAEVTAVDKSEKFELMSSLGADHLVNYTEDDFTKQGRQYDLILDVIARKSVFAYRRALKPNGKYRMVGGSTRRIFGALLFGTLISKFSSKKVGIMIGQPNNKNDMALLSELYEENKVRPVIDRTYQLDEVRQALAYLEDGHALGNLIITMS